MPTSNNPFTPISSIPVFIELIKADVAQLKEIYPTAPLDNCVTQLTKCLTDYAKIHTGNDSELFRQAALEMVHRYFECLKQRNLAKANETLNRFVEDNPTPSENLRSILFWIAATAVVLGVVLSPIALIALVDPVCACLFIFSPFGFGLLAPASDMAESINHSSKCDFDKHMTAKSIWAISSPVGAFFKQFQTTEQDSSSCCFTENNDMSYMA